MASSSPITTVAVSLFSLPSPFCSSFCRLSACFSRSPDTSAIKSAKDWNQLRASLNLSRPPKDEAKQMKSFHSNIRQARKALTPTVFRTCVTIFCSRFKLRVEARMFARYCAAPSTPPFVREYKLCAPCLNSLIGRKGRFFVHITVHSTPKWNVLKQPLLCFMGNIIRNIFWRVVCPLNNNLAFITRLLSQICLTSAGHLTSKTNCNPVSEAET